MWNFAKIRPGGWLWTLRFRPNKPHLYRMDRELKVEQLKWPLYVLDEVIVAPGARSPQFIRASGFRAEGQGEEQFFLLFSVQ